MSETPLSGPILCPVDFSELSARVLRLATFIGERCSCPVTALHATWFEVPPYLTASQTEQIEAQRRDSIEQGRSALQRFVSETIEGHATAVRVEEGDPREEILRVAQSTGSSLIVMGAHGRSGIQRLTLGSVAEEVVHSSSVPVLTVRQPARSLSKLVCAVNDSEVSRRALLYAASLAQCLGAHLTVIHVLEPDNRRAIPDLCAWISQQKPPDCEIQEVTRHGHAIDQIIQVVEEQDADLLVIGAEHKVFRDKTVVGTTTTQLLRDARSAILIVPGGAIQNAVPGQVEQAA